MSEVRGQAYTELYRKLDTKYGENDVHEMAKLREKKTRDFNQIKYIMDETDRLLVKDEDIKNIWKKIRRQAIQRREWENRESWMTQLTPTGDLFGEFKSLMWKKL
jgi:hypothetical protein